ncbi:MAG: hypothetical protein CL733_01250 [Chloroflexi bacterium]|nr:hypothetical protein [Chloroflexota bacterium]|tara:strand:+ start:2461 stop:3378 length:918 start_codon:yes stop_codon:yes gene_type:complete
MEFALLGSNILITSRPNQWIKNFVVFIPVLFSFNESWTFIEYDLVLSLFVNALLSFGAFTFIAIAIYFINDVLDKKNDLKHPTKKQRPIASGELSTSVAIYSSIVCIVISFSISLIINPILLIAVCTYFLLMTFYSYKLKEILFLDIFSIALGFVIRVVAGAIAIDVPVSIWLCLCMLFGALFIAVSKRFSEIWTNDENFLYQRLVLERYSKLSKKNSIIILAIVMGITLVLYILYTLSASNLPDNNAMVLTVPLVIAGMGRYFYLVINSHLGEKPEIIVVKDLVMKSVILSWICLVAVILYYWR